MHKGFSEKSKVGKKLQFCQADRNICVAIKNRTKTQCRRKALTTSKQTITNQKSKTNVMQAHNGWISSSEKEHKVNALASGADEGRDKLRKAAGSCK